MPFLMSTALWSAAAEQHYEPGQLTCPAEALFCMRRFAISGREGALRAAQIGAVIGTVIGFGLSAPAGAQNYLPFFGKQPAGGACQEVCELVRTVAWTPYPHEACFTSPAGRTLCQPYTQYRADDRYVRRCRSEEHTSELQSL